MFKQLRLDDQVWPFMGVTRHLEQGSRILELVGPLHVVISCDIHLVGKLG